MIQIPEISEVNKIIPKAQRISFVSKGGFKYVYKAEFKDGIEAVKLVKIPTDEKNETIKQENIRRVQREINILGKCKSPFLVKLGRIIPAEIFIENENYIIYSEEFLEGLSLRERIKDGKRPDIKELATLMKCLLSAVREIASQNVIHRDIKPENIMALNDKLRHFVLLDLGIAYVVGGTALTRDPRAIPGTLYYLAPEMLDLNFRKSLDYRADLYTCGLTVYEYAAGKNPFARTDDPEFTTLYRIKIQQPPPLSSLCDLPADFCDIIDGLLKKKPVLRPANINLLTAKMEGFI